MIVSVQCWLSDLRTIIPENWGEPEINRPIESEDTNELNLKIEDQKMYFDSFNLKEVYSEPGN